MLSRTQQHAYLNQLKIEPVIREVEKYIKTTEGKYSPSQQEFGGRLALVQAKKSFLSGNYGVGAALFVYKPHQIEIFLGKNKVVTGKPSERFNAHAETDSIKAWLGNIERKKKPDIVLKIPSTHPRLCLYTNIEPCPKCEMEITYLYELAREYIHPQARVQSICLATDGMLEKLDGVYCGSGSAHALGKKSLTSPLIWRSIQRGYFPGQIPPKYPPVIFSLLHTLASSLENHKPPGAYIATHDKDLVRLGWEIFAKTRGTIDNFLAGKKIGRNTLLPLHEQILFSDLQ